jgi:hypothetical protein
MLMPTYVPGVLVYDVFLTLTTAPGQILSISFTETCVQIPALATRRPGPAPAVGDGREGGGDRPDRAGGGAPGPPCGQPAHEQIR